MPVSQIGKQLPGRRRRQTPFLPAMPASLHRGIKIVRSRCGQIFSNVHESAKYKSSSVRASMHLRRQNNEQDSSMQTTSGASYYTTPRATDTTNTTKTSAEQGNDDGAKGIFAWTRQLSSSKSLMVRRTHKTHWSSALRSASFKNAKESSSQAIGNHPKSSELDHPALEGLDFSNGNEWLAYLLAGKGTYAITTPKQPDANLHHVNLYWLARETEGPLPRIDSGVSFAASMSEHFDIPLEELQPGKGPLNQTQMPQIMRYYHGSVMGRGRPPRHGIWREKKTESPWWVAKKPQKHYSDLQTCSRLFDDCCYDMESFRIFHEGVVDTASQASYESSAARASSEGLPVDDQHPRPCSRASDRIAFYYMNSDDDEEQEILADVDDDTASTQQAPVNNSLESALTSFGNHETSSLSTLSFYNTSEDDTSYDSNTRPVPTNWPISEGSDAELEEGQVLMDNISEHWHFTQAATDALASIVEGYASTDSGASALERIGKAFSKPYDGDDDDTNDEDCQIEPSLEAPSNQASSTASNTVYVAAPCQHYDDRTVRGIPRPAADLPTLSESEAEGTPELQQDELTDAENYDELSEAGDGDTAGYDADCTMSTDDRPEDHSSFDLCYHLLSRCDKSKLPPQYQDLLQPRAL